MKKITLLLIMLGFLLTANAQYVFDPIVGPTNVAEGSPVTINLNDAANTEGVPVSSTGSYDSFSITADWVAGGNNPYSVEADLTVTTSGGSVLIDPPTTSGNLGADAVITFVGDLPAVYDPTTDGYFDIVLNQSWGGSDANWSNIEVTLFESPTCIDPTGISASTITSSSVNLDWMAGDSETVWNLEYGSGADFTPGNGEAEETAVVNGTPSTLLTGLAPATTYFVYYQADCGTDDGTSLWVGPLIFDTECVTFTAPFTEDFENAGEIPLCWSMDGGDDWFFDDDAAGSHVGNNGVVTGNTLSNGFFAWSDASGNEGVRTLTSPLVDVSGLAVPSLSFYEISDREDSANSTLVVEVFDGAAWNNMATFNTNTSGWELKVIDISTLTITGDVQARFIFSETETGDFDDDIAIDDVTFDEAPSCFAPAALMANAITSNSAELSWSQDGMVSLWNIEIVPSGDPQTETPTESDISNPYTATGLDPIASYDYYVQANCGGELSNWTGPFTFMTLCDVFIPDYIENFADVTFADPPECWEEADSGDVTTGPMDLGASSWTADEFLNVGADDGAYKINMYGTANLNDWIISPQFDLTGGPFQVEFDFAITEWNSDDSTEPLDSDDTVQLLMTPDNGTTWIELLLYNSTSNVPIPGIHPVVDLTAYSGQTVQFAIFASEGTAAAPTGTDVDVFVDNFRVRNIPTCPEPSDLSATNLSLSSTELSWVESGGSTSWNIQYGEAEFTLGTGTVETNVTDNPFVLTDLMPDTSYEFYVQAICGPGDESSYAGPFEFFTGYCESMPASNDGDGVLNTTIGITDFPSPGDVVYENQTSPVINVFQGLETDFEIIFGHIFTHDTNIWIDFNDDLVFEASEIVYQGESSGGSDPHTLADAFLIPVTAPLGEHRMRIGTADSGQANPDPCYDGFFGVTLDFTVNIQELTCTLPEATFSINEDCDNDQFFIDVEVTDLGDATSLEISNTVDANTEQATATGTYQVGPFPFPTTVRVFVTNEQDNNCVIGSDNFELLACPPENDNCDGAITAVVNNDPTCDMVTSGTILAATPSGVPVGSCTGNPGDDVWFEFTALNEVQIISLINITGGTTNLDHSIYEGTCGSLTEIACSDDDASVSPQLVVGDTYYVRVFSGGSVAETSTFDLCIREAPNNIICENAENFCSVGGALSTPNIIGIPDPNDLACLGSAPNPVWNIIQIGETGPIEIEISQFDDNGNGLDVDFVLWGPFTTVEQACTDIVFEDCPTCPNNTTDPNFYPFGNIVDCSFSFVSTENLSIDNAQEDEIYMLLVTNYNGGAGTITIEQTNLPDTGSGTIDAEISAEIDSEEVFIDPNNDPTEVDEVSVCGFDSVTIEADSPFADSYIWFKDGITIDGETSSTLTVTESDNYQVRAFDDQCGDDALSQIVIVNLYDDPGTVNPQNLTLCDGPGADGMEDFDLDALTTSLGFGDGFSVSYYTNMSDANQAMNAVVSPYTSTGETLIIRVEDSDAANDNFLGCRQLSEVELVVNARPVAGQPENIEICSATGSASFDLTSNASNILDGLDSSAYTISYHGSMMDADDNVSELTSPYLNNSSPQTIYARLEDNTTGCYEIVTFDLIIGDPSQTAFTQDIEECDDNDNILDDFADFDLDAQTPVILGSQDSSNYNVTYHNSQADADAGANPLVSPYSSEGQTIYVRVEDVTLEDCYVTNTFEISVLGEANASIEKDVFYYDMDTDEFLLCLQSESVIPLSILLQEFTENEVSVQWQLDGQDLTGATGLSIDADVAGDYSAIITVNATGCSFILEDITVTEIDNCVIPQGISPGVSEGSNDTFDLRYYDVTKLEIFNRNGTLVYSKRNYTDEWVGQTNDGEELPVGTYFYTMEYEGGAKRRSAYVYINR